MHASSRASQPGRPAPLLSRAATAGSRERRLAATARALLYTAGLGSKPLTTDELRRLDAWWRAANHLSVGQICFWKLSPHDRGPASLQAA